MPETPPLLKPLAPQPPPPKKMAGCTIALLVIGAGGLIIGAVIAFAVYRFSQTEEGKRLFETIGEVKDLYGKAVSAPGVKEARDMGCSVALVFDLKDAEKLGQKFAEKDGKNLELPQQLTLLCAATSAANVPTCKDLAAAYHSAPGAAQDPLLVIVTEQGEKKPGCQEVYDASGARLPDPPGMK